MPVPQLLLLALLAASAVAPAALAQDSASGPEARIGQAFIARGMPEPQAACFGEVIGEKLEGEDLERAAAIVEEAESGEVVRQSVLKAGMMMMDAFSAANNSCRSWGRAG